MPPRVRINNQEWEYLNDLIRWLKIKRPQRWVLLTIVLRCRAEARPTPFSLKFLAQNAGLSLPVTLATVNELETMGLLRVVRASEPGQTELLPVRYDYIQAALEAYPRKERQGKEPPDPTFAKYGLGEEGLEDDPWDDIEWDHEKFDALVQALEGNDGRSPISKP